MSASSPVLSLTALCKSVPGGRVLFENLKPLFPKKRLGLEQGNGSTEDLTARIIDAQTGEIVWAEKSKLRAGSLTCADGRIYCYGEDDGTAVLIDASPTGWTESGRVRMPQQSTQRKPGGKIWTPPVISGGRLFLRNQELLFCFNVKAKGGRGLFVPSQLP